MGVVGLASSPNCSPPLLNPRRGASDRNGPPCPRPAAASGQVVAAAKARPASDPWGKGATGSFPFSPRSPLGPRAHAGLGVRASRSARPRATPRGLARLDRRRGRLAQPSGWSGQGAEGKGKKGEEGRLTRGALVAVIEMGSVWAAQRKWADSGYGLGRLRNSRREIGPLLLVTLCFFKAKRFDKRFN
jgi:hypothetical protein